MKVRFAEGFSILKGKKPCKIWGLRIDLGCAFILPNQNLFSKQSIVAFPARATHASVQSTELSKNGKCGETLNGSNTGKWAVQEKMDSVLRNYFAGGKIRKTETKDFW